MPLYVLAQDDDLPPTDDTPLTSIDTWVPFFIIIALLFGFMIVNKNRNHLHRIE